MNDSQPQKCADCPFVNKPIEDGCPDDAYGPAISGRTCVGFVAGEHLFEEGDQITGLHCMHSGNVALVKRSDGDDLMIAMVTPGDVLGMPEALSQEIYQNGARALEDTSTCFIPKEEVLALLKKNPAIMFRIMRKMCERIHSIEEYAERYVEVGRP